MGAQTEAGRKRIADAQRRSWRDNRDARRQAIHNPTSQAKRIASLRNPEVRAKISAKRKRRSSLQIVHERLSALPPSTVEQQERIEGRKEDSWGWFDVTEEDVTEMLARSK